MTGKQNTVKTCTKSPKKEKPPTYGNRSSSYQKRKCCPDKAGMNQLKSCKTSNLLLCKINLELSFPTTATRFLQLRTYPTTGEVSKQDLLTVRIQWSNLSKLINFFLYKKRCAAIKNPSLSLWSYKACNLFYFASRRWFNIKLWP